MDFLQGFEKKYIPNLYEQRQRQRRRQAIPARQKALTNPQDLSWKQIRLIMRLLKTQKKLPKSYKGSQIERKFLYTSIAGIIPSFLLAFSFNLIKDIYVMNRGMKFVVMGTVFGLSYAAIVYQSLHELNSYNRTIARKYASQLQLKVPQ